MMPSAVNLIAFLGYPLLIANVYASPVDIRQAGVTHPRNAIPVRRDVNETILPLGNDASPNGTLFGHGLFEATDEQQLCARGDDASIDCEALPSWYHKKDILKFFDQLSDAERTGLWEEIGVEGKKMKALMDNFAGRGVSRRSEMPGPRDGHFNKYKRKEKIDDWTLLSYDTYVDKSTKAFQAAGLNDIDVRREFEIAEYISWGPPPSSFKGPSTVFLGSASPARSALVSSYYNPAHDFNPVVFRAYGSTLAWGAWAIQAKAAKIKIATLKYHLLHTITDRLSNHIMAIAHDLWSMDVDQIPPGDNGEPGFPQSGHGRWANDHPAFETLLGIPEVQGAANMIADYNNRMDNPYIAAIHTLPGVRVWDYPFSKYPTWRDGEIIIEFGPKPAGLAGPSLAEGTVATS